MASNRPSLARNRAQASYDVSAEQVRSELQTTIQTRSDLMASVRQLLDNGGLSEDGRKEVFDFCIDQLNSDRLTNHVGKELVGKLLAETEKLSGHCLVGVAELLIEGVKLGKIANGRSIELFPRILSVVGRQESIKMDRAAGAAAMTMTGLDCKSHLINSLFGCRWAPSSVSHIANISRDVTLIEDELKMLIDKLLRVMRTLSPQELPPLVYQLMVLSHKGHHTFVMTGIRDLFTYLEEIVLNREENDVQEISCSSKELLQTEGTVLHHISHAIKHNHELTKEYLKGLKVTQSQLKKSTLTPFTMALALSLIRVHKFEDAVMDFVKNVALKCFKDEAKRKSSTIIQELAKLRPTPNIEKVMFDTVEHSIHGWDSVVSGLVMVGFHLLDTFSPKTAGIALGTPQMKACLLGGRVLYRCVKSHQSIRQGVLYELVNRILTSASVCAYHYIGLLSDITSAFPHETVPKLSETFGFLNSLPSAPAVAFLKAVLPLLTASAALRDSLLIVLRKLLFSKHLECRKTAVGGYLLLLRKFKVLQSRAGGAEDDSQNSQFSPSQSPRVLLTQAELHVFGGRSSRVGNEALCLEIVGALRRCLSQQDEVRMTLYEGLYGVFYSNTKMAEPILSLLINQFDQYYETESYVTPPIKLASCMLTSGGITTSREPLASLLNCLQLCLIRQQLLVEGGAEPLPQLQQTRDTLTTLADRMSNCEMDDFELDKSSDYSPVTSVGSKNYITAKTIMGLYEGLLDYAFTSGEYSLESCQLVLKLFTCYQMLHEVLQDKGSGAGRRGSTSKYPSGKNTSCVISLPSVVNLLQAVFSDNKPSHQQPLAVFRESTSFVKYVLVCVQAKIHQLSDGDGDGGGWLCQWTDSDSQSRRNAKSFKECCSIGKILYTQISTEACNKETGKKEKGKSVHVMCLDSFHQLVVKVVLVHHGSQLNEFLAAIIAGGGDRTEEDEEGEEERTGDTRDERLLVVIQQFQRLALGVFNGTSKDYSVKDVQTIVALLSALSDHLETESEQLKEVYEWTMSQCREFNISDIPVCKAMLSLLFQLGGRQSSNLKTIRKVSQAIHYHVGDIDENVEFDDQEVFYAIVSPQTACALLPLLYTQIEQILDNSAIIVSYLATELAGQDHTSDNGDDDDDSSAEVLYTLVADCLSSIVFSCHELVQTKPNTTIDGIVKVLIKLYETLGDFAKYSLSWYTHQLTVRPSFRKLCDKVGKFLCQQIYVCIQSSQSLSDTGRGGKGKGKGKGKAPSAGKVLVRKETKLIPKLIYELEQFEKYLLQLSKKSKINLLENFTRSTSRDFRIFSSKLEDIMNEEDEEEEDDDKMDVGEEEEEGSVQSDHSSSTSAPPKTKRLKRK